MSVSPKLLVEADPATMIDRLSSWTPVTTEKWPDRPQR
jgi:hypothetical protein